MVALCYVALGKGRKVLVSEYFEDLLGEEMKVKISLMEGNKKDKMTS